MMLIKSAKDIPYKKIIILFLSLLILGFFMMKEVFLILNHVIFLAQNLLKLYLLIQTYISGYRGAKAQKFRKTKLKKYSILIPLYQEKDGIKHIISAMNKLRYPTHLLEIKLIIEQDDEGTLKSATRANLPSHFEIIRVPYSIPRTKPKALNFAMQYVTGEYVVIYDAEDEPRPDQLLEASAIFAQSDGNLICLQAKLSFRNKGQNLLTKFSEMEYRIWFDYLLPGIDRSSLPIPLGGSSNHLKVKKLREIGLWDSYNVTEDADLGIRICQNHFQTEIMDSVTIEEAPFKIRDWIHQRSRWIKGFLQTLLVLLYNGCRGLKTNQKIFTMTFLGFSTYSFLILPLYLILCDNSLLAKLNLIIFLIYMYCSGFIVYRGILLVFWPFYFALHTFSAYLALYQLFFKPFKWNKTRHYFHI